MEYEINKLKIEKECMLNQLNHKSQLQNRKSPCFHEFNENLTGYHELKYYGCKCKKEFIQPNERFRGF